jgi:ABC-type branched-subunit amino acid transport system substrate-binding protein
MNQSEFYQVGGDLRFQHPSYVKRKADEELYQELKAGEFCYVFNSRQTGKSSLGKRVMQKLKADGYACAFIYLSGIGGTIDQWYFSVAEKIARQLSIMNNISGWWKQHLLLSAAGRFGKFIETVLLTEIKQKTVVFIDEIDSVRSLNFSVDDFFAFIRGCYNHRVDQPAYQHLTFALLGVATPSNLIQNKNCTPFNIGKAIELRGFQEHEVEPLAQGLYKENLNPQAILREILYWTGGQPFLTQKLCRLVAESVDSLPFEDEAILVRRLAIEKIIKNWEQQDNPKHFLTINERLLSDERLVGRRLMLYQQILRKGETVLTDSPEQWELRLSGIVDNQSGKLKVYNPIYAQVFNLEWLRQKLGELSPFAENMLAWEASNRDQSKRDQSRLLQGQALIEAVDWSKDKNLSNLGSQFLVASRDLKNTRRNRQVLLFSALVSLIVGIGISTWLYHEISYRFASCAIEKGTPGERIGDVCFRTLITSGEKLAFLSRTNSFLDEGTNFFTKGYYKEAKKRFDQAKLSDPSDPVPAIFSNNAQARLQGNPLRVAVAAAIDNNEEAAKAILRGVADAQYEFNSKYGKNKKHNFSLEIVISNDGNQEQVAEKVAKDLASNRDIIGIIGPQTSESVKEVIHFYREKETLMPVVSPTSTSSSSNLNDKIFFRTVDSTKAAATELAGYIKSLGYDRVAVVYKHGAEYSQALKGDFEKEFKTGKIDHLIDLNNDKLNIEDEIDSITKKNIKAVLLISNLRTNSVALAIARKNDKLKLPPERKLHLIGADALFEKSTLAGGKAVEGLTLVSPCLSLQSAYTKNAAKRWELKPQEIDWRTASSYDATQAFIKAIQLSKERTRVEILKNLENLTLPVEETSGFGLEWGKDTSKGSYHSNVKRKYCLFRIHNNMFEEIKPHKNN